MRDPQTTTVDGWRYTVRPLPTGRGLALAWRLARMLGPAFSALLGAADAGAEGALGKALDALVERVTPDELVEIARELAGTADIVQPGGAKPASLGEVFDVHFAGDYLALMDFLRFALEVNFGPFVEGLRRRGAARKAAAGAGPAT